MTIMVNRYAVAQRHWQRVLRPSTSSVANRVSDSFDDVLRMGQDLHCRIPDQTPGSWFAQV